MGVSNVVSDLFNKYKYYGIAGLLAIVAGYIYKKYVPLKDKDDKGTAISAIAPVPIADVSSVSGPGPINSDILRFQKLLKILTQELMKTSKNLIEFNTDKMQTSNYLNNRNNLFTKDIVTKKILVDSHSIDKSQDHNTSSYTVSFGSSDNPNSYKNVIGFRLLKASVSVPPFHVREGHNIVTLTAPSSTTATITPGVYTGSSLATEIQTRLDAVLGGPTTTIVFNASSLKYTFSVTTGTVTIDFSKSPMLSKTVGFLATTKSFTSSSAISSDFAGNFTQTYVDLVIPDIPGIACKDNNKGLAIIDRIPLIQSGENSLSFYQTNSSEYQSQNYFFPQKLSTLTLKLYQDSDQTILYDSQNGDNTFEFEVAILKNTSLMNK
jgi:hypothetical protein